MMMRDTGGNPGASGESVPATNALLLASPCHNQKVLRKIMHESKMGAEEQKIMTL